jgi:hypothetical protein
MNYINSNVNISKKNKHIKSSNKNNFNKSSKYKKNNISKINLNNNINNFYHINTNNNIYNSIDFALTKTNSNKASHQLHLPYKDSIKSSIISNKNESKNKNKKYTLKFSNSNKFLSFNGISSKNIYNSSRKKSHNIRLNFNNEIINKNFPTENNRKINKRKKGDIYYEEKLKEKNNKINRLKKDLIISEIILNELKNKEDKSDILFDKNFDSINYEYSNSTNNMITKINFNKNKKMLTLNFNNDNFNNRKGSSLINIGSLLTFNYINNNNISFGNNYKKCLSSEKNIRKKNNYFYSLPNSNYYKYNYKNGSLSSKNDSKSKIIFIKKSGPFCEKNINESKNKNDFKNFVEKCNNLKKRTKNILNKYIKLSESFSGNIKCKNKKAFGS